MDFNHTLKQLEGNCKTFLSLLLGEDEKVYKWKPAPDKWSLLEIICHLYDEEREDFRARLQILLEKPGEAFPKIDPPAWVISRNYIERDYEEMIVRFTDERSKSIDYLKSLEDPSWKNLYNHPSLGPINAELIFVNWLAHDYLHIRQIVRTKYLYLSSGTNEKLDYAGAW